MTKKINKKAQLKIQEMSFMILALLLFFIIVALFFIVISSSNLKKDYALLVENKAISTIESLASSPELNCGKQLCVDTDKLIVLKNNLAFKNYWEDIGGIVIKKVYPFPGTETECNTGSYYSGCSKFTLKQPNSESYKEVASFVALCRAESRAGNVYTKCEVGKISAYIKK